MTTNAIQSNFASGELSPKVWGRFDLNIYKNGLEIMENFIAEIQGNARFRTGTKHVWHTRLNKEAMLITFQFNDEQAYVVQITTDGYIRFYRNEGIIQEGNKTITGATKANPVVITSTSHGYSNGDEVTITGVVGMTQLNNKTYLVANQAANTFELTDIDGVNINGTAYTTYSSGGIANKTYEILSPYKAGDFASLLTLKYAQNADVMYLTHSHYDIRKLTRTGHSAWTIAKFSRTADPFPEKAITGATQANPVVITSTSHGFSAGDRISIHEVVGMTQLNHNEYFVSNPAANTFELQDLQGVNVNGTGFTAYDSGGVCGDFPHAVVFHEARVWYGGTFKFPESLWGSRSPNTSTGATRYDDFTMGTSADNALKFTLSPSSSGKVDHIEWLSANNQFLVAGTFGGLTKVTGGGTNEPIEPTSIIAKTVSDAGAEDISPIAQGANILYLQRGGLKLRSMEFDVLADNFISVDRNLVADHIFHSTAYCKQIAFERGDPDILWGVRSDGILAGVSLKSKEDVSGWHRHKIGGAHTDSDGNVTKTKVLSVTTVPQTNQFDQTWLVVERRIGTAASSKIRRYVEFFGDTARVPSPEDFFTDESNEIIDETAFNNDIFEAQKDMIHLDSHVTFNGSDTGTSVTPAAVTGTSIVFTSGSAIFAATDIGKQIWKKAIGGVGTGRAVVVSFTDSTHVVCDILEDFDNTNTIAAGNWFFTVSGVSSGLQHLEGMTVGVFSDGKDLGDFTVTNGTIADLGTQNSVVHIGLRYTGLIKTLNIEVGGQEGAAQSRQRNVEKAAIRFLGTLKAKVGTQRYSLEEVKEND